MTAIPPRFLFYTLGDANVASSRVRGYWVAEALRKLGAECQLYHGSRRRDLARFLTLIPRYDVIVFQKTYSRWHRLLMAAANRLGRTTVIDLDDAPSRTQSPQTLKNVQSMMGSADLTVVGSPNLETYARQFSDRVLLIPSSIRLANYELHSEGRQPVCLGWIGNGRHYQNDLLQILTEPLRSVGAQRPVRLKLVGACGEESLHRELGSIPGVEADIVDSIPWSDPAAVAGAIADFDVGLYPLLPNEFNQFKCGFKALEYMAIGIPVISSRVSVNDGIIEHGTTGFLADSSDQWTDAISQLVSDDSLRHSMGRAGRQKVEREYDVELAANRLLEQIAS